MHLNQCELIEKWLGTRTLLENSILPNLSGRGVTIIGARDGVNAQFQHGSSKTNIAFKDLFGGYGVVCQSGAKGCSALELKTRFPEPYKDRPCNAMFLFLGLKEMGLAEIVGKGVRGNPFKAAIYQP